MLHGGRRSLTAGGVQLPIVWPGAPLALGARCSSSPKPISRERIFFSILASRPSYTVPTLGIWECTQPTSHGVKHINPVFTHALQPRLAHRDSAQTQPRRLRRGPRHATPTVTRATPSPCARCICMASIARRSRSKRSRLAYTQHLNHPFASARSLAQRWRSRAAGQRRQ